MNIIDMPLADKDAGQRAAVLHQIRSAIPPRPPAAEHLRALLDGCGEFHTGSSVFSTLSEWEAVCLSCAGGLFSAVGWAPGQVIDRRAFGEHSVAVGLLARRIWQDRIGDADSIAAFAAGLVHDIGKLVLDAVFPRSRQRALRQAYACGSDICDMERETLGIDHTEAGRCLAQCWHLPAMIERCTWLHHQTPARGLLDDSSGAVLTAVQVANACVRRCELATCHADRAARFDQAACAVNLQPDALVAMAQAVRRSVAFSDCVNRLMDAMQNADDQQRTTLVVPGPAATGLLPVTHWLAPAEEAGGSEDLATACSASADWVRRQLGLRWAVVTVAEESAPRDVIGIATRSGVRSVMIDRRPPQPTRIPNRPQAETIESDLHSPGPTESDVADVLITHGIDDSPQFIPLDPPQQPQGYLVISQSDYWAGATRVSGEPDWGATGGLRDIVSAIRTRLAAAESRASARRRDEQACHNARRLVAADCDSHGGGWQDLMARMAGGAAHELNNPLAVITARAQMLRKTAGDAQAARQLEIIIEQADRASELINELMRTSRPRSASPRRMRVVTWAQRLRQRWQRRFSLPHDAIEIDICDPRIGVFADVDQLTRAADEIAANARDAAADQNLRLQINSRSARSDETIVVSFVDSAGGMSGEVLKRATIPFYSFRPAGRGRGLGLVRARTLVENNGGTLRMNSVPGCGTNVSFHLPAAPPAR